MDYRNKQMKSKEETEVKTKYGYKRTSDKKKKFKVT